MMTAWVCGVLVWAMGLAGAEPPATEPTAQDPTLAALQKAVARNPNDDIAHYNLGVADFNKRRFGEASAEFSRALEINPRNADARRNLASSYVNDAMVRLAAGDAPGAETLCQKAIAVQPISEAYYNLALAQLRKGDGEGAVASLRKAAELSPQDPDPHRLLGQLFLQKSDLDAALPELEQANKLRPNDSASALALATAYERRADQLSERNDKPGATKALDQALTQARIAAQTPSVESFFELGAILYRKEMFPESIEAYKKALAIDPNHSLSRYNLACLYSYRGSFDEAADEFRKIPEADASYPEALKNIGYCMAMSVDKHMDDGGRKMVARDFKGAMDDFRRVAQLDPGNAKAAQFLHEAEGRLTAETTRLDGEADKLFAAGNTGEAVRRWQEVLGLDPEDARARAGLSRANVKLREVIQVLFQDGRTRLQDSDFAGAQAVVGRIQAADPHAPERAALESEIEKAREAAVRAGLSDGEKATAVGKYRDAQAAYERVLRIDSHNDKAARELILLSRRTREDVEAKLKEGLAFRDQGQKEKAKEMLLAVLDLDPDNKQARDAIRELTGQQARQAENAEKIRDFYYKGIDFYTNGQLEQAIEMWKKVLEIDPHHYEANINIQKARRKIEILNQFKSRP